MSQPQRESGTDDGTDDESDAVAVLQAAYERVVDALVDGAIRSPGRASWPTWVLGADGRPDHVRAGRSSLYDGDAGIAYALAELGRVARRSDAVELAETVLAGITDDAAGDPVGDPSLLSGHAGIALARHRSPSHLASTLRGMAADLGSGVAGVALVTDDVEVAHAAVRRLDELRVAGPIGSCWPDWSATDTAGQQPLCGLAHGASGITLALTETAARFPELADHALSLADEALWWEATWFDPVRGGWPDLRADPDGAFGPRDAYACPDLWCHGSAGIGLVRLRLLQLADRGLATPWPTETVQAEAEAAVAACGRAVAQAAAQVPVVGWSVVPGGLTLCHGLAGPLEVLLTAARTWTAPSHLTAARELAATLVRCLPDDPWSWPSGIVDTDGVAGLYVGAAGTALTLARLVHPDADLASAALLGLR